MTHPARLNGLRAELNHIGAALAGLRDPEKVERLCRRRAELREELIALEIELSAQGWRRRAG